MTFKQQLSADADLFFNADELAEVITYNDKEIKAIVNIGDSLQQGNSVANDRKDGYSSSAFFEVKISDIPNPVANDKIVHNGTTWKFVRIVGSDLISHQIECISQYSPHAMRK